VGIKNQNCQVLRHEASIEISQPAGSFTYFTDLTENHYKAMIDVSLQSPTGAVQQAQLIVTPRTGPDTIINFVESAVIQIEDARAVTINSAVALGGGMNIIKDFCMCCPDDCGEVHRHEGTFSFRPSNFTFTDLTENHYKAMVVVKGRNDGQVVVTPRTADSETINIPRGGQSIIQIEDAQAVSVTVTPSFEGPPNTVQIIKDFCISCP
jgi:hypothetical protein